MHCLELGVYIDNQGASLVAISEMCKIFELSSLFEGRRLEGGLYTKCVSSYENPSLDICRGLFTYLSIARSRPKEAL